MRSRPRFLALLNLDALFFLAPWGTRSDDHWDGEEPGRRPVRRCVCRGSEHEYPDNGHCTFRAGKGSFGSKNLPAGEYSLQIRAVGFSANPRPGVNLAADEKPSYDFALQKDMVRWSDISYYQASKLWPAAKGKELIAKNCTGCHLFQTRMASVRRDADGWRDRVEYMRTAMHFSTWNLTDQDADDIASYLTKLFGPDSVLPKSPAGMPEYKETLRPFSSDALNIVYVEYDMPGPSRMPFSSAPDKNGYMWISERGSHKQNYPARPLIPVRWAGLQRSPIWGLLLSIQLHRPPNGSVWFTETAANKLGRWDPETRQITEYQDAYFPGKEGLQVGGQKHTTRLDSSGNVWASGTPLTKFDPETRKFTRFEELKSTYDVEVDGKNGDDVWFTTGPGANTIGKVDRKTLKVSQWTLPTKNSYPRRMAIAPDGMIWVGEFNGGKLA